MTISPFASLPSIPNAILAPSPLSVILFYPHQVHYESENMAGSLILWWNTYEKLLEAKQVWLVGKAQDLFTRGLRGPIHRLLREEAKWLGLLPHMHRAGARGVIPSHWTSQMVGSSRRGQAARRSGAQVSALFSWMPPAASSADWGMCVNCQAGWCVRGRGVSCHLPWVTSVEVSAAPA